MSRRNETLSAFAKNLRSGRRGDLRVMSSLGAIYATDRELGIKNLSRAIYWYSKGAALGDGFCQYQLGFMLLLGEGTPKDTAKGLEWLKKSFENDVAISARLLGDIYSDGHFGVKCDPKLAAFWAQKWIDSGAQK